MDPFYQKTAVVTGAASGIGRALAKELAKAGCHLALADVNIQELKQTHSLLTDISPKVSIYELDVADKSAVHTFADQVIKDFGGVQIVINNAGVSMNSPVQQLRYEDFEWIMGINFWGMVYGTKAFLPHLLQQEESWLANVSSIFGIIGVITQSSYNASKFAIRGFTEALRQEVRGSSLAISSIHPGGIQTNIARWGRYEESFVSEAEKQSLIENFDKIARTRPERAAQVILRGMRKKKKRILVGNDARFLDIIARLFPTRYDWVISKLSGDTFKQ